MPIFVILIVVSLSFYAFYKMKYFRSNRPIEKRWISSKSSIALGLFILFFAFNQFVLHHTTVSIVVGIIFMLVGGGSIWAGYKAYKYYLPLAIQEAEDLNK
ncbi:YtpI family protein [Bacillus timonensis]|nr:YtpI family protein [Bacillus timonensis]